LKDLKHENQPENDRKKYIHIAQKAGNGTNILTGAKVISYISINKIKIRKECYEN
jgi:hypothetical protein